MLWGAAYAANLLPRTPRACTTRPVAIWAARSPPWSVAAWRLGRTATSTVTTCTILPSRLTISRRWHALRRWRCPLSVTGLRQASVPRPKPVAVLSLFGADARAPRPGFHGRGKAHAAIHPGGHLPRTPEQVQETREH